jgi:hypothetical protein
MGTTSKIKRKEEIAYHLLMAHMQQLPEMERYII